MSAALPAKAAVKPKQPRRVLVLNKCAGFVTSSIPLATTMIQMLGEKTGAWSTDVAWESDAINAENLKKYDVILLNSTTGAFLDDPNDQAVTDARRKALLDFVRGGKGLVGLHGVVRFLPCADASPRRRSRSPANPAGSVRACQQLARVHQDDGRPLQVALGRSALPRQARRPEEPDQRVIQGPAVRGHG